MTAQYLLGLDQAQYRETKRLQDLYIGVDVWGRGSHGGGGFGLFKAISHISPESLGLSVALFGPAWTWESEQDKPGWSWKAWWEYENKLWVGPRKAGEDVPVPVPKPHPADPPCEHGSFQPISNFFPHRPPPNPAVLPFLTTFSPGVGWSWFVRGNCVFRSETGWTDVDKTTSTGDLVFPRPTLAWEDGEREEAIPDASSDISMDDAWLGGSSLAITISAPGSDAEDAFFRCVWLPIQSLAITPRKSYRMHIVFKSDGPVDTDTGASIKSLEKDGPHATEFEITPIASSESLPSGWTELLIDFKLPLDGQRDVLSAAGLVVGFACEDPTEAVTFTVNIGMISVYPNPTSSDLAAVNPKVLWADFAPNRPASTTSPPAPFSGVLTWDTGVSLGPLPNFTTISIESPLPLWILDCPPPGIAYFNLYAQKHTGEGAGMPPEEATFIGTTGLDGRANRFYVDPACIPAEFQGVGSVRFYIQGVSAKGKVLDWEDCAFVDVDR